MVQRPHFHSPSTCNLWPPDRFTGACAVLFGMLQSKASALDDQITLESGDCAKDPASNLPVAVVRSIESVTEMLLCRLKLTAPKWNSLFR
jgi:hypothetical protein